MEIVKEQLGTAGTVIDTKIRKAEREIVSAKEAERTKYVEYREGIIPQGEYVAYKMRQEGRLNDLSDGHGSPSFHGAFPSLLPLPQTAPYQ